MRVCGATRWRALVLVCTPDEAGSLPNRHGPELVGLSSAAARVHAALQLQGASLVGTTRTCQLVLPASRHCAWDGALPSPLPSRCAASNSCTPGWRTKHPCTSFQLSPSSCRCKRWGMGAHTIHGGTGPSWRHTGGWGGKEGRAPHPRAPPLCCVPIQDQREGGDRWQRSACGSLGLSPLCGQAGEG